MLEKNVLQFATKTQDLNQVIDTLKQKNQLYKKRIEREKEKLMIMKNKFNEMTEKRKALRVQKPLDESINTQKRHANIIKKLNGGGNSRLISVLSFSPFKEEVKKDKSAV